MAKDVPPYADLAAKYRAILCLHEHKLPDTRRCDLFRAVVDFMDKDRIAFPGLRSLAAITRIGRPTVGKLLDEFSENGLIEYLDETKRGAGRRMRVNPEKLAGYVASHAVPLAHDELASHVVPVDASEVAPGGNHFEEVEVALSDAKSGTAYSALIENKNTLLVPQGVARHSDASGPLAPEKGDVRQKTDCHSNDAVQKKTVVDRQRLNNINSARARRT